MKYSLSSIIETYEANKIFEKHIRSKYNMCITDLHVLHCTQFLSNEVKHTFVLSRDVMKHSFGLPLDAISFRLNKLVNLGFVKAKPKGVKHAPGNARVYQITNKGLEVLADLEDFVKD